MENDSDPENQFEEDLDSLSTPEPPQPPARMKWARDWLRLRFAGSEGRVWVACGLALATWLAFAYLVDSQYQPLTIASISAPPGSHFDLSDTSPTTPAISPDGRSVVFAVQGEDGGSQLWVRRLDSPAAQPLLGTDSARFPFWSPDSKSVAFFVSSGFADYRREPGGGMEGTRKVEAGKLFTVSISEGHVRMLADAPNGRGGTWNKNGVILFSPAPNSPLMQVSAKGGPVKQVTQLDRATLGHAFPSFLPDGRHFLCEALVANRLRLHLVVGSLDSPETGDLGEAESNAIYSGGYLLSSSRGLLQAQPFSTSSLSITGDALPVAEDVNPLGELYAVAPISASLNGVLVYSSVPDADPPLRLSVFDRASRPAGPAHFDFPPSSLAIHLPQSLRGTSVTRDWSPDGKYMLLSPRKPGTRAGIWTAILEKEASATKFLDTLARERDPKFSPDGHWVAYTADAPFGKLSTRAITVRPEVFITSFPTPGVQYKISTEGGERPQWRPDGKEIFFQTPSGRLMAADFTSHSGSAQIGEARSQDITLWRHRSVPYEVSRDGQRFLRASTPEPTVQSSLTIVWGWPALPQEKKPIPDNSFPLTGAADKPIAINKEPQR